MRERSGTRPINAPALHARMFESFRANNPGRPLAGLVVFAVCRAACAAVLTLVWRVRVEGAEHVPATGPLLVVANHQSHLDPPAIGSALRARHLSFLARDSLFRVPLLGPLIDVLNATPVARGAADTAAIRATLGLLAKGRAVLVFPEGTRSADGSLGAFKRGVWLLATRAKCAVLPVAITGSGEAWPRGCVLPRPFGAAITVRFGPVLSAERLAGLRADEGLALIRERVEELLEQEEE